MLFFGRMRVERRQQRASDLLEKKAKPVVAATGFVEGRKF
jgi:hypothetical protein